MALATAYLLGDILAHIQQRPSRRRVYLLIGIVGLSLGFTVFQLTSGYRAMSGDVAEQITNGEGRAVDFGGDYGEHKPIWSADFQPAATPVYVSGDTLLAVHIGVWESARREFDVLSDASGTGKIHTFWFPGWQVRVNGLPKATRIDPDDGTILFDVSTGYLDVMATFEDTPVRALGSVITLVSGLALGLLASVAVYRTKTA